MRPMLIAIFILSISNAVWARPGDVSDPLVIPAVPFVHRASTSGRASAITSYDCLSSTSEAGPEVAYRFRAPVAGRVTASVTGDGGGVDIDVHILTSLQTNGSRVATDCLARGDRIASAHISAGDVFVVVDTYQAASHAGAYTLRVDFQPDDDWYARPIARGVTLKTKSYSNLFGSRQSTSAIEVDLGEPNVVVKPIHATTCTTTSNLARAAGAVAAINAGFFDTSTGRCGSVSLVKVDGQLLARNAKSRSTFGIDANGQPMIAKIAAGADWPAAHHAVGGVPRIVSAGRTDVKTTDEGSPLSFETTRHPRTAVGITATGALVLTTVDGRTSAGAGMTLTELAQWIIWMGAANALNMDGGGSTTLWAKGEPYGGVVNYPSDNGQADHAGERAVGSAIGVWAAPLDRDLVWLTAPPATTRVRIGVTWSVEVAVADPEGRAVTVRAVSLAGGAPSPVTVQDRGDGAAAVSFTAAPGDAARSPLRATIRVEVAGGRAFSRDVSIVVEGTGPVDAGTIGPRDAGTAFDAGEGEARDGGASIPSHDGGSSPPEELDAGVAPPPVDYDAGGTTPPPGRDPGHPPTAETPPVDDATGCAAAPARQLSESTTSFVVIVGLFAILVSRRRGKARADTRFARGR